MKIFDEDGNYLGEFIKDSIEDVYDSASDAYSDGSWLWALILLLIVLPAWTILGGLFHLLFKAVGWIFKLLLNIVWWIIRLPFTLIFCREFPEFEM